MADNSDKRWIDLPLGLVPDRLSFVPGERDRSEFHALWREVQPLDLSQMAQIMRHDGVKTSRRSLLKYTSYSGWTGRAVFRNKVSIIALYLSEHLTIHEYNNVKFFWVHPDYHTHKTPLRLLQLARIELPEYPTRVSVNADATTLHKTLRDAGWSDVTDVEPTDDQPRASRRDFRIGSVAEREYLEALEAGGVSRKPAAHGKL